MNNGILAIFFLCMAVLLRFFINKIRDLIINSEVDASDAYKEMRIRLNRTIKIDVSLTLLRFSFIIIFSFLLLSGYTIFKYPLFVLVAIKLPRLIINSFSNIINLIKNKGNLKKMFKDKALTAHRESNSFEYSSVLNLLTFGYHRKKQYDIHNQLYRQRISEKIDGYFFKYIIKISMTFIITIIFAYITNSILLPKILNENDLQFVDSKGIVLQYAISYSAPFFYAIEEVTDTHFFGPMIQKYIEE